MAKWALGFVALLLLCESCLGDFLNKTLVDGKPWIIFIREGQYAHFDFDYLATTHEELTVTATPLGSGDPDLFVNVHKQEFPKLHDAEHSSLGTSGREFIAIPYSESGNKIWISVQAPNGNCNVSVVVKVQADLALLDGIPQNGHDHKDGIKQYTFQPGPSAREASFSFRNIEGSATMYVSKSGQPDVHFPETYEYKSFFFNLWGYTVRRDDTTRWPSDGIFHIAMEARTRNASYTITAQTDDEAHTLLLDGRSVSGIVESNEFRYYKYQADNLGCNISIQLTPLSGNPDLFVSMNHAFPNTSSTAEWMSLNSIMEGDNVIISNASVGVYYVGVRGSLNSSYTITASGDCKDGNITSAIILQDGFPTQGYLPKGSKKLYKYFHSGSTRFSFSVSALAGDPDMYISRSPFADPSDAEATFVTYGSDFFSVSPNQTLYCNDCWYYVLIKGATSTTYTLTVKSDETTLSLQNGVSVEQDIARHSFLYTYVRMDQRGQDLTIVVTDLAQGDPDLYVSTIYEHPSKQNHTWKSETIGADAITIAANDPDACSNCIYYISVFAFTDTHVSITATWGRAASLIDGVPRGGFVAKHAMMYYEMIVFGEHDDLSLTVVTGTGRTELFVSETMRPLRGNSTTYQFKRDHDLASKTVLVGHGSNIHCTETSGVYKHTICRYYIAVYGYTEANFTITASTNHAITVLQNNQPHQESIGARLYEYFKFSVTEPGYDLSITLTKLSGDPDLYVSKIHHYPNRTQPHSETTTARGIGDDSAYFDNATVGTYYIGVYGFRYSTFTLMASLVRQNDTDPCEFNTSSCDVMTLIDGQPQGAKLHAKSWRFFRFYATSNETEIKISLSRALGDPDLYLRYGEKPTKKDYDLRSARYGKDFLVVREPTIGEYFIGVYAYSSCTFTIRTSTQDIVQKLQSGVSIEDMVNKHGMATYAYDIHDFTRDITFIVTPLSGDPDLNVTVGNHSFASKLWLEDSVTIPSDTLQEICGSHSDTCRARIRVYGFTAATYTVVAVSQNETELADGIPQDGSVHRNQYAHYILHCAPQQQVSLTATPTSGDVDLYVSRGRHSPTVEEHDYAAPRSYLVTRVQFVAGEHGGCADDGDDIQICTFTIAVRGRTKTVGASAVRFSLMASTDDYAAVLQQGLPVHGWAMRHTVMYYRFDVPVQGSEVLFELTRITGDPDLYVSQNPRPTRSNYYRRSIHFGSDGIIIENANATSYYIGVYSFINASYTLTGQVIGNGTHDTLPLIAGTPQAGYVPKHGHRRYRFSISDVLDLTITLSASIGDPDLNVTSLSTHESFVQRRYKDDVVVIHRAQPGTYLIDVSGYQDSVYTILAATADSIILLLDGVSINDQVPYKESDYFEVYVDSTFRDLTVTVTALEGDPDLYISDSVHRPGPAHGMHNYSARLYGEDSITIPAQQLHEGFYYIAVFAPLNNCSYSIMSTFQNQTILQDGTPQSGKAFTEAGRYYVFFSPKRVKASLRFTLQQYRGQADIFISNHSPPLAFDMSTYGWRSHSLIHAPVVNIASDDPNYHTADTFYVLVHCLTNCSYALTASSSISVTSLQAGVTQVIRGNENDNLLFSFDMTNSNYDLEVAVTEVSGRVDLQVSKTSKQGPWEWTTVGLLGNNLPLVDIPHTDPRAILGTYYILVGLHSNATFGITAYAYDPGQQANITGTLLTDSIPQLTLIKTQQFRYFRFEVDQAEDVTISVTPRYGDPDVYVTLDGTLPTRSHAQFHSYTDGSDEIRVPRDAIMTTCGMDLSTCTIRIGVYAFRKSLSSITATSSARILILEPGQTYTGSVLEGQYREFMTYVEADLELSIEVVPISSGDPDLYLASYPHPNQTHNQYARAQPGGDSIRVPSTNITGGYYYISVYGDGKEVSFRLTASVGQASTTLVDAAVQNGFVQRGEFKYFTFYTHGLTLEPTSSITIMLHTRDEGNAVMYASTQDWHPSEAHHEFSTDKAGVGQRRGVIKINPSHICDDCDIHISVYGITNALFSLLGVTGEGPASPLPFSEPLHYYVTPNAVSYYLFLVDTNDTDVSLVVTTISGAVDLYLSRGKYPNRTSFDYSAEGGEGRYQAIEMDNVDPGVYYVGIYAKESTQFTSQFSITASADNTMLHVGSPQSARLEQGGTLFFLYTSTTQDLEITVQPTQDQDRSMLFDIYVSTDKTHPDRNTADFFARLKQGESLRIPQVEKKSCSQIYEADACVLYVSVNPYASSDTGKPFRILATTPDTIKVLPTETVYQENFNQTSTGAAWAYYETFVSAETVKYLVELTPCVGETDIYVDFQAFKPTLEGYTWKSAKKDGIDSVEITEPRYFDTSIYIGVHLYRGFEAQYEIRSRIQYQGQEPYNMTKTPAAAMLTVKTSKTGDSAVVVWDKAGLPVANYFTIYWVRHDYVHDRAIITYTACGLRAGLDRFPDLVFRKEIVDDGAMQHMNATIDGFDEDQPYEVNVIAHLHNGESVAYEKAVYTHTAVGPSPPSPRDSGDGNDEGGDNTAVYEIILALVVPLFILCGIVITYLAVKNRRLTRELEVEMHDVPIRMSIDSATPITSSQARGQSQRYSRLLSEVEDDMETDGDFAALPEV